MLTSEQVTYLKAWIEAQETGKQLAAATAFVFSLPTDDMYAVKGALTAKIAKLEAHGENFPVLRDKEVKDDDENRRTIRSKTEPG